jgi:AraC family ethanolamine operon transcriptional activator
MPLSSLAVASAAAPPVPTGPHVRATPDGWEVRYAQLGAGHLRGRCLRVESDASQVCLEDWSLAILKSGRAPRGAVSFLVPVGGGGSPRIQGLPVAAGDVVVRFGGDEFDYRSAGPARLLSVSMARDALDGHVRALLGRHLGELRLQGRLNGLRTDEAQLPRFCHDLAARAFADPHPVGDRGIVHGLERTLVKLLLAGFDIPREPPRQGRGRVLARRAEAWLRQNLADPPSIAVLCDTLHASPRTLHEAFREHMGTTPKAYVKVLRLNAARHDLLRGGPRKRVTDVALDWGFVHFGWFSQDYRRLFGETPSQTRERGRMDGAHDGSWSGVPEAAGLGAWAM